MRIYFRAFAMIAVAWAASTALAQQPLGTTFTYQGRLQQSDSLANGDFVMVFELFSVESGGTQIATLTFDGVGDNPPPVHVADGLFTVPLDFGVHRFSGDARWLQIHVAGTALFPRQEISATPYALYTPGTMTVVNVRDFGAVADDSMPDTEAINEAIASVPYRGTLFFPPGVYNIAGDPAVVISNAITVVAHGAVLDYGSGTGTAVMVGTSFPDRAYEIKVSGLSVVRTVANNQECTTLSDCPPGASVCEDGACRFPAATALEGTGLLLSNVNASRFFDVTVAGFARGFYLLGDRRGCNTNYFEAIQSVNNLHGIEIDSVDGPGCAGEAQDCGSCNEHFFNGGLVYLGETFSNFSDTKFIYIRNPGNNNHRFVGMNLESAAAERRLDVAGYRNLFIGNRYEGTNGDIDVEFRSASRFNVLLYGYYGFPTSAILDEGQYNNLYSETSVGIGTLTPAPDALLHVFDPASAQVRIEGGPLGAPSRRAVLSLASDVDYRARGILLEAGNANPWFAGVPYTGGKFVIGRHADQPEYIENALFSIHETGKVEIGAGGTLWLKGTSGSGRVVMESTEPTGHQYELYPDYDGPGSGSFALYDRTLNQTPLYVSATGQVGIGTLTPAEKLHVNGNIQASCGMLTCSDARFKDNVRTLGDALHKVTSLRGVEFEWKRKEFPDRHFGEGSQVGFVAEEVQNVVPQVVSKGSDGYLSVDYGRLTPVLVEAIHELQQKQDSELEALRADHAEQLAALEAQNAELRARLERLEGLLRQ